MAEVTPLRKKSVPESLGGFGRGALVALRSGGTLMVVSGIVKGAGSANMLRCAWNIDGAPGEADYWPEMLIRVEELEEDEILCERDDETCA